jgi:hypothetical protein
MAIKGTVVRTSGPRPFLARFADGSHGGMFEQLRNAQAKIELSNGGIGTLTWTLEPDLAAAGIEGYRGEGP